jgi:hypothetical protein
MVAWDKDTGWLFKNGDFGAVNLSARTLLSLCAARLKSLLFKTELVAGCRGSHLQS